MSRASVCPGRAVLKRLLDGSLAQHEQVESFIVEAPLLLDQSNSMGAENVLTKSNILSVSRFKVIVREPEGSCRTWMQGRKGPLARVDLDESRTWFLVTAGRRSLLASADFSGNASDRAPSIRERNCL
jgi:hypothetical protein